MGSKLLARHGKTFTGHDVHSMASIFPAVTCPVQASMRTALPPAGHGMVANGGYFPQLKKVLFWEQAATLVSGERVWAPLRSAGGTAGMMFWQQSLVDDLDLVLSPRPIHKHEGGMIQDCYSMPGDLYGRLCKDIGRSFNLMHYWGPVTSRKSSEWIADATIAVMKDPAPDLLFSYIPHLDYDLQRKGPDHPRAAQALDVLETLTGKLDQACRESGYDWVMFGDYEINPVTQPPVFPNRILRDAGLFRTRMLKGMAYPDFFSGGTFAMVDHEVAHVYVGDPQDREQVRGLFANQQGIDRILDRQAQKELGLDHASSGDFVLVSSEGSWFAYPWWTERREAPDFATHVDIHNKPGFDPCELYFGWPPPGISMNVSKIGGTHGRSCNVAWFGTWNPERNISHQLDLAEAIRDWCGQHG